MSKRRGSVDVFIFTDISKPWSNCLKVYFHQLDCLDFLIFNHDILRKSEKKAVKWVYYQTKTNKYKQKQTNTRAQALISILIA